MTELERLKLQIKTLTEQVETLTRRVGDLERYAEAGGEVAIYHLSPQDLRAKYPDGYKKAMSAFWDAMPRPPDVDDHPIWRFLHGDKL